MFAPEVQVKQRVAELNGAFGSRWEVLRNGAGTYLFVLMQNPDIRRVVRPCELQSVVRSALANGWGHA
jgi:hypothetical protein